VSIFGDEDGPMWAVCAERLGLPLRVAGGQTKLVDNFGYILRSLGPPAHGSFSTQHWMCGAYAGVPVLGHVFWRGSGRHRSRHTTFLARVDPPLFLGLQARSAGLLGDLFAPIDIQIGHPRFDADFHVGGRSGEGVRALLASQSGRWETMDALVALKSQGHCVEVTDNMVRVEGSGAVTSLLQLRAWLDGLTFVARRLGEKRARVPRLPGELPDDAWARFAEGARMDFDRARMKVTGSHQGTGAELRLYTEQGLAYTEARAYPSTALGLGLRVFRQPPMHGLLSFFGAAQDVAVGDPAFDGAFVVQAFDEQRARRVLADPTLRLRMLGILQRTGELCVTDAMVWTRLAGAVAEPAHLAWLLGETTALARLLSPGAMPAPAPYR
jgi:hypothetical protein